MPGAIDPEDFRILKSTSMFRGLHPRLVERVLAHAVTEIHGAGNCLFRQGCAAQSFFLILDGWAKIIRQSAGGVSTVIGVFTRGQTLADAVAITESRYPATAETVTRARVMRIDAGLVRATIRNDPEIALAMIASTAQHMFALMQQIEQLKALKAPERVAEFLLSLVPTDSGPAALALPFDKSLIAARLGMQPESLSRAFVRLRDVGVHVDGSDVRIADVAEVARFMHAGDAGGSVASTA